MRTVKKTGNGFLRAILIVFGILFVVLGIIGIIFPLLPATPFFMLSAWCFMKSSDRLYHWLQTNKIFGKYLKNYIEGNGIPVFVKIFLLSFLWLMIGYTVIFIFENIFIKIILLVISVAVTFHIMRIKTLKAER